MFSLITAVIAIALVVALVAATSFYGGSGISEAQAQAEATRLKNEEQQIFAAVDSFNADAGRYPNDLQELLSAGYLSSSPRGWSVALATPATLLPVAHADGLTVGWSSPEVQNPVFETASTVPQLICSKYNLISRGDDGILKQAFAGLRAQCFGVDGSYRIAINKGGRLASALKNDLVLEGGLPAASGTAFWDKVPSGDVKVETDPGKTPFAKLSLTPTGAYDFGQVQAGQFAVSSARTVINQGNIQAEGLTISAPAGFELASSSCAGTLGAGASCSFTVKFAPASEQPYTGQATVHSSNTSAVEFTVTGNGAAPSASLAINSFGLVAAGSAAIKDATFTNTGVGTLTISAVAVSGNGFSLETTDCSGSLAARASCTAKVRFTAHGTAAQTGSLTVETVEAGLQTADLDGQSHQSVAELTSTATVGLADWYQPGEVTATATYRNAGNTPMTLLTPTLTAPLSVAGNTCSNVAPAASCTITVALTRDANTGGTGAQSFIPAGAGVDASPVNVNWSIYSTVPTWSATSLDFGDVQIGGTSTKSVTLVNAGSVAANWSSAMAVPTGFAADLSACSNVVPTGSCTVNVTFSPTQPKPYSASGLAPSPASLLGNMLSLTGTGISAPAGEQVYTTPGTFTWTVPAGVTSVSAVVVGSGQNGGQVANPVEANTYGGYGGALRWRNAIAVTPGTQISVTVGGLGTGSAFGSLTAAGGGSGGGNPGSSAFDANTGGGNGGQPGGGNQVSDSNGDYHMSGSGGGAGGYTGNGGWGSNGGWIQNWGVGSGGAGNGGGNCGNSGGGGGGVGLYGPSAAAAPARAGGSGGAAGLCAGYGTTPSGGRYGGGGGGGSSGANVGGSGAVRIIWGTGRSFPNNAT